VTLRPDAGYRYVADSLTMNGKTLSVQGSTASFAMPAEDVFLTATFEIIPQGALQHTIAAESVAGGTLTPSKTEAAEGEEITVTATPAQGYSLVQGSLRANGTAIPSADGAYRFLMPDKAVTLTAEFAAIEAETPNGALFKTGAAQDFVFVIDKDYKLYDKAAGLVLNSEKLPQDAYEVREGSTRATVYASYLDTRKAGEYSLRVPFTDGAVIETGFKIADNPLYKVAAGPLAGGTLTPDKSEAAAGEPVTLTVTPETGYRLVPGSLKWDGRAINADDRGRYSFTMPAWDVTLTAEFIETGTPADPGADDEAF
jgi:hypothetical protein